jgi:hypothetical protein
LTFCFLSDYKCLTIKKTKKKKKKKRKEKKWKSFKRCYISRCEIGVKNSITHSLKKDGKQTFLFYKYVHSCEVMEFIWIFWRLPKFILMQRKSKLSKHLILYIHIYIHLNIFFFSPNNNVQSIIIYLGKITKLVDGIWTCNKKIIYFQN